ncbi:alpha/beta hydrolase [Nocardioides sp.]|uniref:alpha/beta hydrolase n=1 Tax=Nocardioides sp. TaxID=35761 RepID=UPI003528FAC6
MALYPQVRADVERAAAAMPIYDPEFDIAASRSEARRLAAATPGPELDGVRDLDAGGVPCRLYRPAGALPGVIVHLHGGGFVFHDVEVHDAPCRRLADAAGIAVLSVDYRLAPEHRFPAAVEDVDAVVAWLDEHAAEAALDGPAYLHGDSAGGNLALGAALRHPGRFRALGLIYPFLDPTCSFPSYAEPEHGGFEPAAAAWYWQQYAGRPGDLEDPDLAPLLSTEIGSLPPTMVVTAEHDPLRDEGEELARRAAEAGVEVVASRQLGQVHGFWRSPDLDAAEPVLRQVAAFLRLHHGT